MVLNMALLPSLCCFTLGCVLTVLFGIVESRAEYYVMPFPFEEFFKSQGSNVPGLTEYSKHSEFIQTGDLKPIYSETIKINKNGKEKIITSQSNPDAFKNDDFFKQFFNNQFAPTKAQDAEIEIPDDPYEHSFDQEETKKVFRRNTEFKQSKKFVTASLNSHNFYRKIHGSPNLRYSSEVASVSQRYANKLIGSLANGGKLKHNGNTKYGENLWMGSGYDFTNEQAVQHAVKQWYNEISMYKYFGREPPRGGGWGHFTQIVWKNSQKLGVGIARKNGIILVVANYDPPGNVITRYNKNVRKPQRN